MRAAATAPRGHRTRLALLLAPPQGVVSLGLWLLMLLVVGVAVADARRLVGPGSGETSPIPVLMVLAGLLGYVLARSSLGILRAHVIGASAGAALILLAVAARVVEARHALVLDPAELSRRMEALWAEIVRLSQVGPEAGLEERWPFALLVLAAICWTTGQFGALSIFRHDRAAPAVLAGGLVLLLNVSFPNAYASMAALPGVVAFAILALLLLMRMNLGHQQAEWARRHIADAREVTSVFLRTGVAFVLVATLAASVFTAVAVSDRGALSFPTIGGPLDDLREEVLDLLTGLGIVVPDDRVPEEEFGDREEIADTWEKGEGIRFRATSGQAATTYWWGAAYATFDGRGWSQARGRSRVVSPGATIPSGRLEMPGKAAAQEQRSRVSALITPVGFAMATLVAPATAVRVTDRALTLEASDPGGVRAAVSFAGRVERGETYSVTSLVLADEQASDGPSAEDLRRAGTDHPDGLDQYLEIDPRASGPRTRAFAARIEESVRGGEGDNAYDKARLVQDRLRGFRYEPDMVGRCGDLTASECLFEVRMGFCQHFATAMALALREMGIPTRLVHGYLPGEVVGPEQVEVPLQAAHAWVEVFFPGFGWLRFDPTPSLESLGGMPTALPEDEVDLAEGSRAEADVEASLEPDVAAEPTFDPQPSPALTLPGSAEGDAGPDLAALLLATLTGLGIVGLGLLALGLVALRRLPAVDPELAYRGVANLATRLGHGPRPSQTAYEFMGELADTLPSVRRDLELVAHVRVESAYARRLLGPDSLASLRRAYARVRMALLRLMLRRGRSG